MSIDTLQALEPSAARRRAAVEELGALAQSQAAKRQWPAAAETAAVILQLEPDNQDALYAHAVALISQKEISLRARARDSLERLMAVNPRHYDGAFTLADVYLAIGPLESAKSLLARLLKELPGNPRVPALVGDLNSRLAEALMVPRRRQQGAQPRARRVNRARYPDHVSAFDDLRSAVKKHVIGASDPADRFLAPDARGFTMGSCFAGRIARELDRLGQPTLFLQLAETVNTTHANLEFLRWLSNEDDGSCAAYFEAELAQRGHTRQSVRESLSRAQFVVYTLGVAPAFFHRETGKFRPHQPQDFKQFEFLRDYVYRTTTVEENVANLRAIRELLRKAQPTAKLVLSVSPVPFTATFEMESAIVADCVSKSTLRAAAHEFLKDPASEAIYWPSFEIVRWLSGHIGRVFGNDDGNNHHVSDALVTMIVELFIERFRPVTGTPPRGP
jgi:tetratricopeptide (TPR) repeat protein